MRILFAIVFITVLLFFVERISDFAHLPWVASIYVFGSALAGIVIGDTLYLKSIGLIEASKSIIIASVSYPLFTMVLAVIFLDELLTWPMLLGALLIVCGMYWIVHPSQRLLSNPVKFLLGSRGMGIPLAIIAAFCWALGAVLLKKPLKELNVITINAIRLFVGGLLLLAFPSIRAGALRVIRYHPFSLAIIAVGGVLMGVGSNLLWLFAIQHIGAAKTVILNSASLVLVTPLSVLFFREKATFKMILSVIMSVVGIWLIIY